MTGLEEIIFLADYIEPHRKMIPGLDKIEALAFVNIRRAIGLTLKNTIDYLKGRIGELVMTQ